MTTDTQIHVVWDEIVSSVQTGGAPILSYRLEWDDATEMKVWTTLVGYDTAYMGLMWLQLGAQPGKIYSFRIQVQNA